ASSPSGLGERDVRERLVHEGPNVITEARKEPLFLRFGRHLTHRFAVLLWLGALLAFVADRFSPGEGMVLIGGALVSVVILNAAFSFWQEFRVEKAMAAFAGMFSTHARVLRAGVEHEIDGAEVVAGDILVLREGDRIAADARLFEAHGLKVDNTLLT